MTFKRNLALALCGSIPLTACAPAYGYQTSLYQPVVWSPPTSPPPQSPPTSAPQQTPARLQQLVAPIALYPDSFVAQILAAATYPAEVVEAERWMAQHAGLKGQQLADEANTQSWDPSVKALTAFPSVLANMNKNLSWTSSLGEAYVQEPQEVMSAIQDMRHRAQNAGDLRSTPQQTVTTQGQNIVIQPTNPQVVYVPQYDPWLVYGPPLVAWPGWYPYPGLYLVAPGIVFGLGIGIGLFAGFGWGWHHWGCNWAHRTVVFNHNTYISRRTTVINHRTAINRQYRRIPPHRRRTPPLCLRRGGAPLRRLRWVPSLRRLPRCRCVPPLRWIPPLRRRVPRWRPALRSGVRNGRRSDCARPKRASYWQPQS
jgi:hypothetical protein